MKKQENKSSEKGSNRVFQVTIKERAFKQLSTLPRKIAEKIDTIIQSLAYDPYPHGCKKLQGYDNIFLQASDIVYNNAIIHAKINDIYGNSLFDDNIQLDATGRAQKSLTGLPIGPAVMQALDPVTNESLAIKQLLVTP